MDPTGVEELPPALKFEDEVHMYASGNTVHIKNTSNEIIDEIAIYNLVGQEMLRQRVPAQNSHQFSISGNSGYYIVQAVSGIKKVTTKVYIQ